MRSNSYTAIAGSTGSSLTSAPIPVSQMTQFSVVVSVAGDNAAAGTVTVQASNDVGTGFPVTESSPSPWVTLPAPATATVSGNGQVLIPITNVAYQFIRVVYTRSAGTGGVIVCTVDTTGPSPGVGFWPGGDLGGTVTSQTVIGIQGNPVSSTAPATNDVLTWSGTEWAPAAGGGGGGGGSPAQPAAWGDEYLWWKLDDALGVDSAANSGSAGSATLSTTGFGQGPSSGYAGPYSLNTKFRTNYGYGGASGLVGSITNALTASVWVKDMGNLATTYFFLAKASGGGNYSLSIKQSFNTLYYSLRIGSNGSGTLYDATSLSNLLSLSGPYFLALTYDGTTIRGYLNGVQVASNAQSGTIDWNTGSPDVWFIGDAGAGASVPLATLYDARVAPSVRTASQLFADYKTGMGYSY